jgi:predicted AlkP superfamily pyrophosphatase or phosphodiesterase
MNQTGIRCILVFSLLFAPFSNGHAESTNKTSSSRTILISFDGAQPAVIEKLLEQKKLPRDGGFAELIGKGTRARGMTSVLPTLTATSHITMATGAYPERTNIPMNSFHNTESPLTTTMEQLERLADYLKDAMLLAMENHDPDLLMGYQVQTDEAGHQFLLVDPRQQTFEDSAKRERYAAHIEKAYQIADRNLKDIIEAADLKKTNIIAVSDHGMAPMHTFVYPNRILRAAGLVSVIVTSTGAVNVNAATSQTNAVTSGGAANIYINLQGREPSGIVSPEQYANLQNQIADIFKAINDPVTNEPVFSLVLRMPEENKNLHAKNGKSFFRMNEDRKSRGMQRDFHVFSEDTAPGYHLEFNAGTATEAGSFFQPSTFFGQHGHDPRLPEMKAIFYAAGPDFKHRSLREVGAVDIAPTVAQLLDIDPPEDAQGKKISTRDDNQR